jgi:hypothetical protein
MRNNVNTNAHATYRERLIETTLTPALTHAELCPFLPLRNSNNACGNSFFKGGGNW